MRVLFDSRLGPTDLTGHAVVTLAEDADRVVRARLHGKGVSLTVLADNGYTPEVRTVFLYWTELDALQQARRG